MSSMWFQTSQGEYLTPGALILPNVAVDIDKQLNITEDLIVCPFKARRDEGLFAELSRAKGLLPLPDDARLANRALFSVTLSSESRGVGLLDRFRLLLSLHPIIEGFDPAHVATMLLHFHRTSTPVAQPSSPDIQGTIVLDGVPTQRERAKAAILGLGIGLPTQTAPVSAWTRSEDLLRFDEVPDEDEVFSLILRHLLYYEDDGFWRALRLFGLGIRQSASKQYDVASALIVASLEALFPTHGKDAVLSQFKAMGSMLVPHPGMPAWFGELYDIRSSVFHRGGVTSSKDGRHRGPRLIRDIEVAKSIFALCAIQLRQLRFQGYQEGEDGQNELVSQNVDAREIEHLEATKRVLLNRIHERLMWDNKKLSCAIARGEWKPGDVASVTFQVGDESANLLELVGAGFMLLCLYFGANIDLVSYSIIHHLKSDLPLLFRVLGFLADADDKALPKGKRMPVKGELERLRTGLRGRSGEFSMAKASNAFARINSGAVYKMGHHLDDAGRQLVEKTVGADLLELANELRLIVMEFLVKHGVERHEEGGILGFAGMDIVLSWVDIISDWNVRAASFFPTGGSSGDESD